MSISTGRGDGGETDLQGGRRVPKDHLRIEVCGQFDELAAGLGLVRAHLPGSLSETKSDLGRVQDDLLSMGAVISKQPVPGSETLWPEADRSIARLEKRINELEAKLPRLRQFIRPAGPPAAAFLHSSRTLCRRAERRLISLHREEPVPPGIIIYLNRLSDLLFLWAREVHLILKDPEEPWENPAPLS
ncbi:MAG: cob(I)yrinic acid a,c-diamide adenosyltransferase [Candidatus Eisenbacteria bacterium]|uniref:Corrinoid adenosyltransferase n=1 Tax=Eiseniibacteriota bacterium TaxID=2212470 RepID=A0A948RTX3_UNCEI|nr:cob(I)yrinic acid a,c-diamide adenosyltransferase [Candidatus Eisenbacteria bacterium]MBU1948631.1 cob(I)yrinic acid a,c-diamide adenosyltransferase [Candidatus Eisenbacteria bacterium]MBU2689387.1 cob(I)yrinic acid a,c-diamide adenosyltransferase [Candidatus Eisenbacteria bacterium]